MGTAGMLVDVPVDNMLLLRGKVKCWVLSAPIQIHPRFLPFEHASGIFRTKGLGRFRHPAGAARVTWHCIASDLICSFRLNQHTAYVAARVSLQPTSHWRCGIYEWSDTLNAANIGVWII